MTCLVREWSSDGCSSATRDAGFDAGPCPPGEPENGSPCAVVGLGCAYGAVECPPTASDFAICGASGWQVERTECEPTPLLFCGDSSIPSEAASCD